MTLLLSVTIKVALLLLTGLAATALLHRRSAAVRHWVLTTTLVACVCIPALELTLPSWSIPLPFTSPATSSLRFVAAPTPSPAGSASAIADAVVESRKSVLPSLTTMLAATWGIGALVGLAVLIVGLLRLRTLAATAEPVSTGLWRDVADEISIRYGIRQHVRILDCHHPTLLATWGVMNPTILLPAGALRWSEERVQAVLHHELAHIRRGDWVIALIATLLTSVYWFNPLLWVACRRLRHEGERACDDLVLASGISGPAYATHLLDVARESALRRHPWSPAIAIAHHSMLERRVRAMLNARVNRDPMTVFARATTVVVIAALAASVGVVSLSGSTEVTTLPVVEPARLSTLPILTVEPVATPVPTRPAPAATPAAQAPAQGGTIEGVLYDPFGGLLPGASVGLTEIGSGKLRSGLTDRGGSFAFKELSAGDYELVTELPGFTTVKIGLRTEPGATVRRHITLPIGTVQETIHVTCSSSELATSRPTAPTSAATPGATQRSAPSARGSEPKIPSTFTGGIGGQIKAPTKLFHVNPICPAGVAPQQTVVRLAGRIGIDGFFTDLHDVSTDVPAPFVASAIDASRQWVFTPTLLNGAPIEANIRVTVSYSSN